MISPLPTFDKEKKKIVDGSLIKTIGFCKKANRKSCINYYDSIKDKIGFSTCPYGFTSFVVKNFTKIYTSLRVENHFSHKKVNPKINGEYLPKFNEELFNSIIQADIKNHIDFSKTLSALENIKFDKDILEVEMEDQKDFLNSLLHEIRKLNAQVKSQSEEASRELSKTEKDKDSFVNYRINNIFATSSLISVRLNSYDIKANPSLILTTSRQPILVYKKFEKVKHCLHSLCFENKININFIGESYNKIDGYDIFEILPFLLIENAIKYSHRESEININFEELSKNDLKISISSFGPRLNSNEIEKLFERKFRGQNAIAMSSGSGNGLYLAKMICDLHNIELNIKSDNSRTYHYNQIPYSSFKVNLLLNNTF